MKKISKNIMWFFCFVFMMNAIVFSSCSGDGDDVVIDDNNLVIINLSGIDFDAVYMSPSSKDTWQDILGDDVFMDEEKLTIKLNASKSQGWDIKLCEDISNTDKGYIQFTNLNLKGISTLTLIDKSGELWYTLQ